MQGLANPIHLHLHSSRAGIVPRERCRPSPGDLSIIILQRAEVYSTPERAGSKEPQRLLLTLMLLLMMMVVAQPLAGERDRPNVGRPSAGPVRSHRACITNVMLCGPARVVAFSRERAQKAFHAITAAGGQLLVFLAPGRSFTCVGGDGRGRSYRSGIVPPERWRTSPGRCWSVAGSAPIPKFCRSSSSEGRKCLRHRILSTSEAAADAAASADDGKVVGGRGRSAQRVPAAGLARSHRACITNAMLC
jgi:hypothetical protein